jgi:formylglycine-generating enzyme required for sulfatase activity
MRTLHALVWSISLLLMGCSGGTGNLATDAGVAADASVALDLQSHELKAMGNASGTGSASRLIFRRVPAGTVTVGRVDTDVLAEGEERSATTVSFPEFLISSTELTQDQWWAMAGTDPWEATVDLATAGVDAARVVGPNRPAVGMTRAEVLAVCQRFAPRGWRLALPTPAQWEYAAVAGTLNNEGAPARFSWGDLMSDTTAERNANVYLTTPSDPLLALQAHVVGSHLPNAFGLYDMHGNVWEMTDAGGVSDVVVCGGAWDQPVLQARATNRMKVPAAIGLPTVGVRLILVRE